MKTKAQSSPAPLITTSLVLLRAGVNLSFISERIDHV